MSGAVTIICNLLLKADRGARNYLVTNGVVELLCSLVLRGACRDTHEVVSQALAQLAGTHGHAQTNGQGRTARQEHHARGGVGECGVVIATASHLNPLCV